MGFRCGVSCDAIHSVLGPVAEFIGWTPGSLSQDELGFVSPGLALVGMLFIWELGWTDLESRASMSVVKLMIRSIASQWSNE